MDGLAGHPLRRMGWLDTRQNGRAAHPPRSLCWTHGLLRPPRRTGSYARRDGRAPTPAETGGLLRPPRRTGSNARRDGRAPTPAETDGLAGHLPRWTGWLDTS
ncbi:unnamed protein product, partial [Iphiclides podalirius]